MIRSALIQIRRQPHQRPLRRSLVQVVGEIDRQDIMLQQCLIITRPHRIPSLVSNTK